MGPLHYPSSLSNGTSITKISAITVQGSGEVAVLISPPESQGYRVALLPRVPNDASRLRDPIEQKITAAVLSACRFLVLRDDLRDASVALLYRAIRQQLSMRYPLP